MEEILNESTTESTSAANTVAENDENPIADGGNPITNGDEDSASSMQSPFDQLLQFEEFDNLGDILGDVDPSDNPFAGGVAPSGDVVPSADGSDAPEDNSNKPLNSSDPNTNANPLASSNNATNDTAEGFEGMPSGEGGSMMNADFGGTDTGAGNTDNGNGNNFVGDSAGNSGSNNQADGNGNWFYGNDNQTNGNGNWNFGNGNQVEGNGNWNLNEESADSNPISEGGNNPLAGGNSQSGGAQSSIPEEAFGGNNPAFAGGSTTPAPVGGEIPDTAESPTGNQNTVSGNGNWSLGDNNEVSGNGNRPSGDNNSISGNGNRLTGDDNNIEGNRFESDADGLNAVGNGDRYLVENEDGSTTLVSDESAGDSNYDYSGVVKASADSKDESAGQDIGNRVYASLIENTGSVPDNSGANGADGGNSFGGGSDTGAGGGNPFGDGSDAGASANGGNLFGGGSDAGGGNPFGGGASNSSTDPNYEYDFSAFEPSGAGDESSIMNTGENPFGGGSDAGVAEGENSFGGGSDAGGAGGSDPNELIRQSPFGVLLDIPGIDGVEDIFGNVGGAGGAEGGGNLFGGGSDAGASASGGNPFGGGASNSSTDPNYEYDFSAFEPSGAGDESSIMNTGENPFGGGSDAGASAGGEGNPFGGDTGAGGAGGGNPFGGSGAGGAGGGNPFGGGSDAEANAGGEGNPFGGGSEGSPQGSGIESDYDYNWDFDFADPDFADPDSLAGDRSATELEGETPLLDETDLANPPTDEGINPSVGETPVFDAESSQIELPNGVTINLLNEAGESDLSIAAPVMNEDSLMVGELDISFPDYVEDYFSSVFDLDEVQEFNSNDESAISDIQDDFDSLFGVGAPILGEDNVLQLSGGFEIDLSRIMSDSGDISDSSDSAI